MILNPIRCASVTPIYYSLVKQTRTLRPSIKIGKERFQLSLDVRQFNKDEIRVKAHPEYVMIEGKQERNTEQGYILRHFIRKFKLPEGCLPLKIETQLSPEGILTITAPRSFCDVNSPCDAVDVPITYGLSSKVDTKEDVDKCSATRNVALLTQDPDPVEPEKLDKKPDLLLKDPGSACDNYPKVKPIDKK